MFTKNRFNLSILCVFALVSLIAYSSVINSFFLSDDFVQIGRILDGDYRVVWGREHGGFFRPLFVLSLLIDTKVWHTSPFGFHLTNVLLHGATSFLIFSLAQVLIQDSHISDALKRYASLAAGLLFALHPSHTEAVTWISGRADLLATFFGLLCLRFYVAYANTWRTTPLVVSLAAFALALLSKESAVCLPLLVFVIGVFSAGTPQRKRQIAVTTVLFLLLTVIFIIVRAYFVGAIVGGYGSSQHLNFSFAVLRDGFLQFSLRSLLPPVSLALAPVLTRPLKSPVFIAFALTCAALLASVLFFRHKRIERDARRQQNRMLLLLLTLFLCSLAPVIQMGVNLFDTMGERFVYLPSVFASIAVAYLSACALHCKSKNYVAVIILLLLFYAITLHRSNRAWGETSDVSQNILNGIAHTSENVLIINAPDNLRGVHLFRNGLPEALRLFQHSARAEQVEIISFHDLENRSDRIHLERDGDAYRLQLQTLGSGFTRVNARLQCVEVQNESRRSLYFRLRDCSANTDMFFFNEGEMRELF